MGTHIQQMKNEALQKEILLKDGIIERQEEYREKSDQNVKESLKIVFPREGEDTKLTVEQFGKLAKLLKETSGEASQVLYQNFNDFRKANISTGRDLNIRGGQDESSDNPPGENEGKDNQAGNAQNLASQVKRYHLRWLLIASHYRNPT
jgi:hypothetical protein